MRNLILIVICCLFFSCGNSEAVSEKLYPTIDKIEGMLGVRDVRLYIIDDCEYIGHVAGISSDFLTHKGNCKFCAKRNKTKKN